MSDVDAVLEELAVVQGQITDALRRGSEIVERAKVLLPPEVIESFRTTPIEAILEEMVTARHQANTDREQIAQLIVLIQRLNIQTNKNASGLQRLEDGAEVIALDLAAREHRADEASGEAGAAADAAVKSAP